MAIHFKTTAAIGVRAPKHISGVNWSSPLASQLVGAWPLLNRSFRDVSGAAMNFSTFNNVSYFIAPDGIYVDPSACTGSQQWSFPAHARPAAGDAYGILLTWAPTDTSDNINTKNSWMYLDNAPQFDNFGYSLFFDHYIAAHSYEEFNLTTQSARLWNIRSFNRPRTTLVRITSGTSAVDASLDLFRDNASRLNVSSASRRPIPEMLAFRIEHINNSGPFGIANLRVYSGSLMNDDAYCQALVDSPWEVYETIARTHFLLSAAPPAGSAPVYLFHNRHHNRSA